MLGVGRLDCGSKSSDVSLTLITGLVFQTDHGLLLIHPLLSETTRIPLTATAPATTSLLTSACCMEGPDTSLTPHTNEPPASHHHEERKPLGKPRRPNPSRNNVKPSKGEPKSGNAPSLGAAGGQITPSTPRSASPDSKGNDSSTSQPHRKHKPKSKPSRAPGTSGSGRDPAEAKHPSDKSNYRRRGNQEKPDGGTTDASDSKPPRREKGAAPHHKEPNVNLEPAHDPADAVPSPLGRGAPRQKRQGKFDRKLTTEHAEPLREERRAKPGHRAHQVGYVADDLTSRLIHDLRTSPYLDCTICYNSIRPHQPIWSCSPGFPIAPTEGTQQTQYCWVTLHLKCVRSWASKSIADTRKAYEARGEDKPGEWSCIGCRARRTVEPSSYRYVRRLLVLFGTESRSSVRCFCGADVDPKPPKLATPHSCGNVCTRQRTCGHSCPILCHPGPCPPCQVTMQVPCHCGSKVLSYTCSNVSPLNPSTARNISCGNTCDKKLSCGKHSCMSVCHPGPCTPCAERELVKCYCGKVEADVACNTGEPKACSVDGEEPWVGRFRCENPCER